MKKSKIKNMKSGKIFEFIKFVQKEIDNCTYTSTTTHVQVKDLKKGTNRYFPINEIEFLDDKN